MPQSLSRVIIHMVFSTYQRVPHLNKEVRLRVFPYVGGILREIGCHPLIVGGHTDHLHLLFGMSRTLSQAQIAEKVKTASSVWVKKEGLVRRDFAWQSGYAVLSEDSADPSGAIRYIQNQDEHHEKVSFMDELRELLRLSGVEYDERYLWD